MAFGEGTTPTVNPEDLSGEHDDKQKGSMTPERKAIQPSASQVLGERGMAAMRGVEVTPDDGEKEEDPETAQNRSTVNRLIDAISKL